MARLCHFTPLILRAVAPSVPVVIGRYMSSQFEFNDNEELILALAARSHIAAPPRLDLQQIADG